MTYQEFIETKYKAHKESGFDIEEDDLSELLFPFQKWIVKTALKKGRYAIFADCGLGKTFMQLEWGRHIPGRVLLVAPLAVSSQTELEAAKFHIPLDNIDITNYEQLEHVNPSIYTGVILDESSILKNYEGKTKNLIIEMFERVPYKLACTATPSPNDPMELGNHAEFLNVMTRSEMLAMYFVHDGGETAKWRIKGHAVKEFYAFISSWACMLCKPSDIGFDDTGYVLPQLNYIEKQIKTPTREGALFNSIKVSAADFNTELRITKLPRLSSVINIINNSTENFIVWVRQNEEADFITSLCFDAVEVRGNETTEKKREKLMLFAQNKIRVLVTKQKIAGFGMNFQNCANQIFASLDFSFEGLYQAIRRSYRFGQTKPVNIYLVTTDTMENVAASIKRKQQQFYDMQMEMQSAMNAVFNHKSKTGYMQNTIIKNGATLMLGDCVQRIAEIDSESIGLSVFSPPFADLYTYSDHVEDMGNSKDYKEFLVQFGFLIKELYRVLKSGRNVAVHCMDLPIQKGKEGYIGLRDFSGMILSAFAEAGFIYHSRITIWKDPVTEMQRTKALGLLHKQIKKDSTMSRVGIPDYVLIFRKDGERSDPVTNTNMPVDLWQKYASPVWMDIDYGDTLNFRSGREDKDEKHICPLQLPTIERLIHLYSNEGDVVLTPFMGIGSEVYQAVKMKRKAIGIELKESYFNLAVKNVQSAILENSQLQLF